MNKEKLLDLMTELDDCVQMKELARKNRTSAGIEFGLLVDKDAYALEYQKYQKRYEECFAEIIKEINS